MAFLDQLYKEAILQHYKTPHNRGKLDPYSVRKEGVNPSCGDELELFLRVDGDCIDAASFEGEGCAISQASASMMTDAIRGRSLDEARALTADFKAMLHGDPPSDALGDLVVLQGVSRLHARVKCATLAWVALEQAIDALDR